MRWTLLIFTQHLNISPERNAPDTSVALTRNSSATKRKEDEKEDEGLFPSIFISFSERPLLLLLCPKTVSFYQFYCKVLHQSPLQECTATGESRTQTN